MICELKRLSSEGQYTARLFQDCVKFFNSTSEKVLSIDLDERNIRRILHFKKEREIFLETKNYLILRAPFEYHRSPVFKVGKKDGKITKLIPDAIVRLPWVTPWRSSYKDDLIYCDEGSLFFDLKDERFFEIPKRYKLNDIKRYSNECGLVLMSDNSIFDTSKLEHAIWCF